MAQAILVIDMIYDFVDGVYGSEHARAIVPTVQDIVERARDAGVPIVYAVDAHDPEDRELDVWDEHAMRGTYGADIIEELTPLEGDPVVEKQWYDAFEDTRLDELLNDLGVDELVLTGVTTNICIQNTAAGAFYKGYDITVPRDATAALDVDDHEYALEYVRDIYGARLVNAEDILREVPA